MNPEIEKQIRSISEHMTAFGDKIDAQSKKVNDVQTQVDAIDQQLAKRLTQSSFNENPIETQMKESDSLSRLFKERRGTAVVKFKDAAVPADAKGEALTHFKNIRAELQRLLHKEADCDCQCAACVASDCDNCNNTLCFNPNCDAHTDEERQQAQQLVALMQLAQQIHQTLR